MSLKPAPIPRVPESTIQIAKRSFPKGNVYLQLRDTLDSIYQDDQFAHLYPVDGQPGYSPWRLALVLVMQFAENLTDRQAANAVRSRIDWKYALSLDVGDAGFDYSILSEFRTRLVSNESGAILLDALLEQLVEAGCLKSRGKQRTDSVAVLASVRALNQLEIVGETMRSALNSLAVVAPQWLKEQAPSTWYARYSERFEDYRLPKSKKEREDLIKVIGADGYQLYTAVYNAQELPCLSSIPAVEILRRVWFQQYWVDDGKLKSRSANEMPPGGEWIHSPYDPEAGYGRKREWSWVGYKLHISEVCDADQPHFITQVETAPAIQPDRQALGPIQQDLADKRLLPKQHIVDAGYTGADQFIESSKDHQIELIGPVNKDTSWQAQTAQGYDASLFDIDWQQELVICPQGQRSRDWLVASDAAGKPVVKIAFDKQTCLPCEKRAICTRAKKTGRRMTLRYPPERFESLTKARQYQETPEFKAIYKCRNGVEGTFSQMIRNTGLRQSRYIGMAKTHLQNIACATATNILRFIHWLNEMPFAKTRTSRFAALAAA